jgi:nitroimidazol reductase NimA-like FMN-containing flavoprotein (pyridoxamine 5'-phosphate oxidase superfamily)
MSNKLTVLSREQCIALLPTVPIGRLIYTVRALPAVAPVNFILHGRDIVLRVGYGSSLAAAIRGSILAFEVDEFDLEERTGWSVTVTGPAREERDDGELERLRGLEVLPWADGPRDYVIRIPCDIVSGRRLAAVARVAV